MEAGSGRQVLAKQSPERRDGGPLLAPHASSFRAITSRVLPWLPVSQLRVSWLVVPLLRPALNCLAKNVSEIRGCAQVRPSRQQNREGQVCVELRRELRHRIGSVMQDAPE